MNLNSIPAFDDNYIWVLNDEAGRCLIVDPGDAEPVLNAITANNWLSEIYDTEIAEAHRSADLHLHDLSMLTGY